MTIKLLLSSDWHLRASNPENRIDSSFCETQLGKIEQIFQIFHKEKCSFLLQAGDLFDTARPSFDTLQYIIKLFENYSMNKENFFCVWGQHDARYRQIERTAFKLMESLNYITMCKKHALTEDIDLYGASWGDPIPIIENEDNFNILVIHKSILDKPNQFWQEDFLKSDMLFKNYPYDVLLAGDNHHPVLYTNKGQTIVGCGTIVRKTISEADIIPHVYILDINEKDLTYELKKVELKYEPADKVFKQEALSRETSKDNKKMQEFINSIKNNEISQSLDFRKNLENLLINTEKSVKDVILQELETL